MATELEGNEKLQRFIQLLCDLNHQTVEVLKTGNAEILFAMNDTVENVLCKEPIIVKGKVFKQDFETVWVKTYKLISDTYPISAKAIENNIQEKSTKNKFGALGGFTKN